MLIDQHGVPQKRLKRTERYVKDRSWHVTLVSCPTNTLKIFAGHFAGNPRFC